MVVGLFLAVDTLGLVATTFARWELLEASSLDGVKFLMLPTMGDDLVGVSAHEVTLQAVEVRCLVLSECRCVWALWSLTVDICSILLEVTAH